MRFTRRFYHYVVNLAQTSALERKVGKLSDLSRAFDDWKSQQNEVAANMYGFVLEITNNERNPRTREAMRFLKSRKRIFLNQVENFIIEIKRAAIAALSVGANH